MHGRKKERKRNRIAKREIKAHLYFNKFLRYTFGIYLKKRFNIVVENHSLIRRLKPPYLVLPNHFSIWDPFIVNSFIPKPVYYVTSDAQFRSPILNFVLGLVGAIPKTKAVSDTDTIRHIMRIKKQNGIIGVFPEGQNTWDGHSLPLIESTAKLIRLLKIPVVVPILKGAYFTKARWMKSSRKGKLILDFNLGFTADEIKKMSVKDIWDKLNRLLEFDDYEYQKEHMIRFKGKHLSENLEQALFICPSCRSIGSMRSADDIFHCKKCNYAVRYNEYGMFERCSRIFHFETIREWNVWQLSVMDSVMDNFLCWENDKYLFIDKKAFVRTGYRSDPLKKLHIGKLALFNDRIELYPMKGGVMTFDIHKIEGINVQNKEGLEFYYKEILYRFDFIGRRVSSLKWMYCVKKIQQYADDQQNIMAL